MINLFQLILQGDTSNNDDQQTTPKQIKCKTTDEATEQLYYIGKYSDSAPTCSDTCDNAVWYKYIINSESGNYAYICVKKDSCPPDDAQYSTYVKKSDKQCVIYCKDGISQYIIQKTSENKVCVDSCNGVNGDEKLVWIEGSQENECQQVKTCKGIGYETIYKRKTNNTNDYSCVIDCKGNGEQSYVWYTTSGIGPENYCSEKLSCEELDSDTTKYKYLNKNTIQCVESCAINNYADKWYQEGNKFYCINSESCAQFNKDYKLENQNSKQCIVCDEKYVWYNYNGENICTQVETCGTQNSVVENLNKITFDRQCVDYCKNSANNYVIQSSYNENQCIATCQDENDINIIYKWVSWENDNICTTYSTCKDIKDDTKIYKVADYQDNINKYHCVQECQGSGESSDSSKAWYYNNVDNLCTQSYWCNNISSEFADLTKRSLNGQCVQYCKSVDQILNTQLEEGFYICVDKCKSWFATETETIYRYTIDENENTCQINKVQCSQDIGLYEVKDVQYACTNNCDFTKANKYLNQHQDICVKSCSTEEIYRYIIEEFKLCDKTCQIQPYYYVKADTDNQENFECVSDCGKTGNDQNVLYYDQYQQQKCRNTSECIYNETVKEYKVENANLCVLGQDVQCEDLHMNNNVQYYNDSESHMCKIDHCAQYLALYPDKYIENYHDCSDNCNTIIYQVVSQKDKIYAFICDSQRSECPPTQYDGQLYQNVGEMKKHFDFSELSSQIPMKYMCAQKCSEMQFIFFQFHVSQNDSNQCVSACGSNEKDEEFVIFINQSESYCTNEIKCKEEWRYQKYEQNICYESCQYITGDITYKQYNSGLCVSKCDENVTWQYVNGEYQCGNSDKCAYNDTVKLYLMENTMECIDEYLACLQTEENVWYYRDDENHVCKVNQCKQQQPTYIDKYDKDTHICLESVDDECAENNYVYYEYINKEKDISAFICDTKKSTCPPTEQEGEDYQFIKNLKKIVINSNQCVEKCVFAGRYSLYIDDESTDSCVSSCKEGEPAWFINDNGENQCLGSDLCSEFRYNYGGQCTNKCSAVNMYQLKGGSGQCKYQCEWIWRQEDTEKVCYINESECKYDDEVKEFKLSDTQQCILESENCLQDKYPNRYYESSSVQHMCERNYCVVNEDEYTYYNGYYSETSKNCISDCHNSFFEYNVSDTKQVLICNLQNSNCPPMSTEPEQNKYAQTLVKNLHGECVQYCDPERHWIMSLKDDSVCVFDCDQRYLSLYGGSSYNDNKFYKKGDEFKCTTENQCKDIDGYQKIQQKEIYNGHDLIFYCIDQCENIVYKKYHENDYCADLCDSQTVQMTINAETLECSLTSVEQCQNHLHSEVNIYNTTCQYTEKEQNCNVFTTLLGYEVFLAENDQNLCISCESENIKQNESGVKICGSTSITPGGGDTSDDTGSDNSDKISSGAIAGIVIGVIVVIAIIVVLSVILIKKKSNKNSKNGRQMNSRVEDVISA